MIHFSNHKKLEDIEDTEILIHWKGKDQFEKLPLDEEGNVDLDKVMEKRDQAEDQLRHIEGPTNSQLDILEKSSL